ncbi:Protein of unknown function, partial [Cotesia congregata]
MLPEGWRDSLESDTSFDKDRMIDLMSEHCIYSSENIYSLIKQLDKYCFNHEIAKEKLLPFVPKILRYLF